MVQRRTLLLGRRPSMLRRNLKIRMFLINRIVLMLSLHIFVLFEPAGASTFSLNSDGTNLSSQQIQNVQLLLSSVEKLVPQNMKIGLKRPVQIHWKNLNPKNSLSLPSCGRKESGKVDTPFIYAQIPKGPGLLRSADSTYVIELDRQLLLWIENGMLRALKYPCQHGDSFRLLQGILLHELFHLYDLHVFSISNHPLFLNAADWRKTGFILKTRNSNQNSHPLRSPDYYEFKSPQEYFAVNFEFFILDSTYQCRRPTLAHLFRRFLLHNPDSQARCKPSTNILLQVDPLNLKGSMGAELDPDRLYQIDYLLAGKGDAASSRWGHSIFRLIFCRPGRPLGPECRTDVAYHVVASFAANVNDNLVNPIKGVVGSYPSQLFFKRFHQVVEEYTKNELRELISLPIQLTPKQQRRMLLRFLELYWNYRGNYRFLTNNCAHEALAVIQVAISSKRFSERTILSPLDLYDYLAEHRLINPLLLRQELLGSETSRTIVNSISHSYYMPSYRQELERSLQYLSGVFKDKSLNHHRQIDTITDVKASEDRRELVAQLVDFIDERGGHFGTYQKQALVHLYRIEDYVYIRAQMKLQQTIGAELATELRERGLDFDSLTRHSDTPPLVQLETTGASLSFSYGIPLVSEEIPLGIAAPARWPKSTVETIQSIMVSIRSTHEVELNRIQTMRDQKLYILNLLSQD
jgi:hypothetical protein